MIFSQVLSQAIQDINQQPKEHHKYKKDSRKALLELMSNKPIPYHIARNTAVSIAEAR
ncbi:hypothetical protein [Aneurinibacillus tyrosinisolvens]|uniref:hypothetical protein n=1 Tax=Aneurinibacillus tyrosinisolvens TaxID=1443435 RepID=UPI000A55D12C|nr:hypothetical protein [Aneurinibacillus tyrosinisolvens]